MELVRLTEINRKGYNRFVAQHPSGSFLQSWEWGGWQQQLGHKVYRFFVKDSEQILLSAQAIFMKVPRLNHSYLYVPYGPLLTEEKRKDVAEFFVAELQKLFPQSLFIRLEPKRQLTIPGRPTPHIQPGKTLVLDLKQLPEQLLSGMHAKTRYNIKVAERHGVQVTSEPIITPGYGLHLQEALDLLVNTASRQGFKSHAASYYKKLIDFFSMQAEGDCTIAIYKALYQQQLLATALMIDFGGTRTYLFGGTAENNKNVMAPYALHWQAIVDVQNKKLATYDFWGIETASGKLPGFVRFKLGWGGSVVSYPAAVDIVQRPAWYTIYNVLRKAQRKLL
jgi:lipid II:glycine glycyltransferase (peptidoglycan interpeptide bridge formation enzyme)